MSKKTKAVTLIEILVFIVLLSLIILALSNIDLFSRHHVISSDRRAKLQNAVAFALEHMTKTVSQAIGDVNDPGVKKFTNRKGIRARIDNGDGKAGSDDIWVAYLHENIDSKWSEIRYYQNAGDKENPDGAYELIARNIVISSNSFNGVKFGLIDNTLNVRITACWDPEKITTPDNDDSPPNGSEGNPCVTMRATIKMPSVSTH